jgi:hypothetical protein
LVTEFEDFEYPGFFDHPADGEGGAGEGGHERDQQETENLSGK